jgi:hypothetical protein
MKRIFTDGSKWPLVNMSEDARKQDVLNTLILGNHKGALTKPNLLQKLIGKDVKYRYSFNTLLSSVTLIPGVCMAPMNIMSQNTINKEGRMFPKESWGSGSSVNSRVQKELLLTCHYGYSICHLVNWVVVA